MRDAERDRGKARAMKLERGELIKRPALALLGGIAAERRRGAARRHEQIVDRIRVAAGALQPNDVPDVLHGGAALGKDQRALHRQAGRVQPRRAVGFENRAVRADPVGVATAACELPGAADAEAVRCGDRPAAAARRADRHQRARIGRENLVRRLVVERSADHRGGRRLRNAPSGAGVGLGEFFDRLDQGDRRCLRTAERARDQHAEQAGLMQRVHDLGREFALRLDPRRRRSDHRGERPGARHKVDLRGLGGAI